MVKYKAIVRLKDGTKQTLDVEHYSLDEAWCFIAENLPNWQTIMVVVK